MPLLSQENLSINHLHIKYLAPFQSSIQKILELSNDTLIIEGNFTGQLSKLITMETGFKINHSLFKYDGEPFYTEQITNKVRDIL